MRYEACANCGKRVNDPLGGFKKEGYNRKCPYCGKNFDIEDIIDDDGRLRLDKLMTNRKAKR